MGGDNTEDCNSWARLLLRAHGPNAAAEARKLAYEARLSGDRAAAAKWTKVSDLAVRGGVATQR